MRVSKSWTPSRGSSYVSHCRVVASAAVGYASNMMHRKIEYMEDRIVMAPLTIDGSECMMVAVFDGHGGKNTASYLCVVIITYHICIFIYNSQNSTHL